VSAVDAPQLPMRPKPPTGEGEPETIETARPSVTITRNAKGQAQWTVKCYGGDASEAAAIDAARVAQHIYDDLTAKYGATS